jgi:hypothetical protein
MKQFSNEAARRYLQTAVFVDDEIFDKSTGMPKQAIELPKARKPIFRPEAL